MTPFLGLLSRPRLTGLAERFRVVDLHRARRSRPLLEREELVHDIAPAPCPRCDGTGNRPHEPDPALPGYVVVSPCAYCAGTGEVLS